MSDPIVNPAALEPLFGPSDIPFKHRVRGRRPGDPAVEVNGRRPSPIVVAQNLRQAVAEWRDSGYGDASDTTVELLQHWFSRDHETRTTSGNVIPFAYYYCQ